MTPQELKISGLCVAGPVVLTTGFLGLIAAATEFLPWFAALKGALLALIIYLVCIKTGEEILRPSEAPVEPVTSTN